MTEKSILFFCGDGNSLVNFRGNLIQEYLKIGYQVYAIAPNLNKSNEDFLISLNVTVLPIKFDRKSFNPFLSFKSLITLIKNIKALNPNIVFSYTHKPLVFGAIASFLCKVPKVVSLVTGTGHIFDNHNLISKLKRSIGFLGFRLAFLVSDFVLFQNKDDRNLFVELGLVSEKKTSVVNGSGVDLDFFYKSEQPNDLTFLCLARLINSKGLREYANAANLAKQQLPNARFLLGGPVDHHNDSIPLSEIESQWRQIYGIEYIGNLSDPREAIKNCSVYVLLSYNEGTPRSVLEAMSMCKPIITTDVNGCRETVKHGINGYLVPIFDSVNASSYMARFNSNDLIAKMSYESRKYCEEKFDVHKVNSNIMQIIND